MQLTTNESRSQMTAALACGWASMFGRSGDDGASGNAGRRGDDLTDAPDGERDLVYCGTGRDTVRADRVDVLHRCERAFRR